MFKNLAIILTLSASSLCYNVDAYAKEIVLKQPPHIVVEKIEKDEGIIIISGPIDDETDQIVHKGFVEFKNAGIKNVIINLNSLGGKMDSGTYIINDMIDAEQHGISVTTAVDHKAYCASMCTAIFAVGQDRMAAPDTLWIFHAPQIKLTDEEKQDPEVVKEVNHALKEAQDYMISILNMADPEWTDRVLKSHITQPGNDLIVTGEDILKDHNHWITISIDD